MEVLATLANMKKYARHNTYLAGGGVLLARQPVCYSPTTGETYSANPGDYWNQPPDEVLLDSEGEPMILVIEKHAFEDVA